MAAADANLSDLQSVEGFVRRELSRSGDDTWLDVVVFADQAAAKQAEASLMEADSFQKSMELMDLDASDWMHFTSARHYHG